MLRPQSNHNRKVLNLDGIWRCAPDPDRTGLEEEWFLGLPESRPISVPGSWNEQYGDLFFHFGPVWYERRLFVDSGYQRGRQFLRIGSACNRSRVWVNGIEAGGGPTAHLPLDIEVSGLLRPGEENHLVVRVDASLDPWGLPAAVMQEGEAREGFFNSNPPVSYDFFPYGGIHRSVELCALEKVFIDDIRLETEHGESEARVRFAIRLSHSFRGFLQVRVEETESGWTEIPVDGDSAEGVVTIQRPRLWDIGEPNLYRFTAQLLDSDAATRDAYTERFGVRSIRIEGDRLLLNGREIFLRGFGKHEDFFATGRGYNPASMIRDFDLLRWTGANSVRTSHYPYAEEFLDTADELGILVIAETPLVSLNERLYTPEKLAEASELVRRMVVRDRNHPSVLAWSVGNEPDIDSDRGSDFFRSLMAQAREEDSSRPVTYVAHREPENNPPLAEADFICLNKYYGWYEAPGDLDRGEELLGECLERYHAAFKKPILMAEFGADATAGTHAEPPVMFSEEFQSEMIRTQYTRLRSKPYVIGAHIWAFADFRTAMSISRVVFNRKGVFTRERQPKLAAHTIRRIWQKEQQ